MKYLFILSISVTLSSCILSTWDTRLSLINQTNERISYIDQLMDKDEIIPDTTNCKTRELYWIPANNEQILNSQTKWEFLFKNHPRSYLRIYIINEDSLKKYGTCQILKQQVFMKRYDLKYDDIVKLNWRVEYKK